MYYSFKKNGKWFFVLVVFFFFKQKTAYEIYQCDWSSDVCSSDLSDEGRVKLTPLANWSAQDLKDYTIKNSLPMHPLVKQGYLSIGCFPCTSKVTHEDDARSGRWPGEAKTECGIHKQTK